LYPDSTRTFISFRDIWKSELHVCNHEDNKEEFLLITKSSGYGHEVLEGIPSTPSRLYYTYIKHVAHVTYKMIFQNVDTFTTWHSRLCHTRIGMMRKIIKNYTSHNLKDVKFSKSNDFVCTSCVIGKLILWFSPLKIQHKSICDHLTRTPMNRRTGNCWRGCPLWHAPSVEPSRPFITPLRVAATHV
jgi:hypothetical protein